MDRKCMCIAICVLISVGAALFICGQAINSRLVGDDPNVKPVAKAGKAARMQRAVAWCMQLAQLMAVVAFLLILCCLCCKDVAFKGAGRSGYE